MAIIVEFAQSRVKLASREAVMPPSQAAPIEFAIAVGERAEFTKTISETDLALFSALSGDFDPIHVDEEYARRSQFGRRIAHGGLAMSLLSTTASQISRRAVERGSKGVSVSLGYDRIRFLAPVFIGDTLTARYVVESLDAERGRSLAKVEVLNQRGELCVAGAHVMKWLPPSPPPEGTP
jgi:acyl dehydratase